jgi:hypothetical protein
MPQDALLIRGRILARLLGLRLLTLDANIVTAPQPWPGPEPAEAGQQAHVALRSALRLRSDGPRVIASSPEPAGGISRAEDARAAGRIRRTDDSRARRARAARAVPGSGVVRARQLVDQSARALDEGLGRP